MESSQQRRYVINNSKVQSASSKAFTPDYSPSNPSQPATANMRDLYLMEENKRESPPRQQQQPMSRNSEYPVKSIVVSNVGERKKALQKYKYINQLARMEFEDKEEEVYSRYTRVSKQTVLKKMKARNQIAEFEDEDEAENEWFDELMEFKFGKDRNSNFHFEKEE
jgi:hypothetical protein